jgi:hypothetical protein
VPKRYGRPLGEAGEANKGARLLSGRARVHGFDNACQRCWRPTSKGSPQAAPTLYSLLKKRAPPLPAAGKRPSSEHRNNVFQDLILIKKQRDFFGIVTNGLIWRRT